MPEIILSPKNQKRFEKIEANFLDRRSMRRIPLQDPSDIRVDRDSFFSIRDEIGEKRARDAVEYFGVVVSEDDLPRTAIVRTCPNCTNGVYTNLWYEGKDNWKKLAILSPNYQYPNVERIIGKKMFDCK